MPAAEVMSKCQSARGSRGKIEELFRKAVQLGQKIATEDNVRFRELLDRVKELWTEYDPKPDASDRTIMGVDSG
jgi:hypothetical protein